MEFTADRLAQALRDARKAKGLSQGQVAESLGVKQPSVSAWEAGRSAPTLPMLAALARLLGLDGGDLLDLAAEDSAPTAAVG